MNTNVKYLENQYCAPKDHSVTCLNPAPWKIEEVKIECQERIWIRSKKSMWFRLDQCILDEKEALEGWLEAEEQKRKEKFDVIKKVQSCFENLSEKQIKELSDMADKDWLIEVLKLRAV